MAKKNPGVPPTELIRSVETFANAVWPRREDIDRMVRSIRGEPEPGERTAGGGRRRRPWMRDTVRYDPDRAPGHRYVVVRSRERPLTPIEAYAHIRSLPVSVMVAMVVDKVADRVHLADLDLYKAKARLTQLFEAEGHRFNPNGTEQHRRRFFQKLIRISERELGIDDRARRAAARQRRQPPPQARLRQQQRQLVLAWAVANCDREPDGIVAKTDLTTHLMKWWRANCNTIQLPSAKLITAALSGIAKPSKAGKHRRPVFIGLRLRQPESPANPVKIFVERKLRSTAAGPSARRRESGSDPAAGGRQGKARR